jgi:long-chain acyl-CoA synthetase
VELDEIEAALLSHRGVEEVAVFALPDGDGSQRIHAAVVPRRNTEDTCADLREHVSELLPWYAVPGEIDVMRSFPRTSSGKIDRRRLREQAMAKPGEQNAR